ncbi:MAG TPA: GNAT family N-acetyltransferase [Flavobacterium sp.]|uniref:GNAT family N-acetyltransferase n=1 Tax=Flavobacterium sp. GCM10027622 TaxID=3273392 RepID=UPI002BC62180|nr:GNAT family N-acetyltransferase [Flavobacterium sp.]
MKDTYWAKNRTIEMLQTSIDNSLCFGIYLNNDQIGFARVITDLVSFAYPMDVFIVEEHRGKGYSKILLNAVMTEPQLQQIKIWGLATLDAHFLYEKFGFTSVQNPEKLMEKIII